jgi:putative addiction module killer protein
MSVASWSSIKGVGGGSYERKVDFGPDYRIYFGKDGEHIVILLGGSSKQRQQQAIEAAKERWADYRRCTGRDKT